jgi:hypothetical protein
MFATESPKRKLSFNENPKLSSVSSLISTVEHKNNFQELLGMCLSVLQILSLTNAPNALSNEIGTNISIAKTAKNMKRKRSDRSQSCIYSSSYH